MVGKNFIIKLETHKKQDIILTGRSEGICQNKKPENHY